jgi:hypothetical protein
MPGNEPTTERNLDRCSAPSAGPPPWNVYRVVPATVFALGTEEPYGATRFDLASQSTSSRADDRGRP